MGNTLKYLNPISGPANINRAILGQPTNAPNTLNSWANAAEVLPGTQIPAKATSYTGPTAAGGAGAPSTTGFVAPPRPNGPTVRIPGAPAGAFSLPAGYTPQPGMTGYNPPASTGGRPPPYGPGAGGLQTGPPAGMAPPVAGPTMPTPKIPYTGSSPAQLAVALGRFQNG